MLIAAEVDCFDRNGYCAARRNGADGCMICVMVRGVRIALDFTAPALLALLSLMLPPEALLRTVLACLLHESAHLLMIALTGQKPALLRISAAGLRLELRAPALCPTGALVKILCAGPAVNLLAAAGFFLLGAPESTAANLSLALFNLLPFRSTDGGSLVDTLTEKLICRRPELPGRLRRGLALMTAALLACGLFAGTFRSPSLWGMLVFLVCDELLNT